MKAIMFQSKKQKLVSALILISIIFIAWTIQAQLFLNWDVGHLLHASELLLAGGSYSHDFFIPNPPLILYVYLPPVLAAKYWGLNLILGFQVYIFFLVGLALLFSYPLIRKIFRKEDSVLASIFFVSLAIITLVLPLYDFGQRDHLLLICALPYLLLTVCRLKNLKINALFAIAIASFAFMGFGLKPQFLMTPFLVELYGILDRRSLKALWRPEVITFLGLLALYLLTTFFYYPDFIHLVIPYVLRNYYGSVGVGTVALLFNNTVIFCYLSLLFYSFQFSRDAYQTLNSILAIALVGFLYSYFSQQTTFYYHLLPAFSLALLLTTFSFAQFGLTREPSRQAYLCLMIPALVLMIYLVAIVKIVWVTFYFAPTFCFLCFAAVFAYLFYLTQKRKSLLRLLFSLAILMMVSFLVYYLAHLTPGFASYQLALTLTTLIILFAVLASPEDKDLGSNLVMALVALSIFSYPCFFSYSIYSRSVDYKHRVLDSLLSFMSTQPAHRSIYAFSIGTNLSSPLAFYSGARLVQRMDCLWPVIYMNRLREGAKQGKALSSQQEADDVFFLNLVAEDLHQQKPDLVIVDRVKGRLELGRNFDYLLYLSRSPRFREEWKSYHRVKELSSGPLFRVEIYQRRRGG